jgi:hypothetical protein
MEQRGKRTATGTATEAYREEPVLTGFAWKEKCERVGSDSNCSPSTVEKNVVVTFHWRKLGMNSI